MEDDSAYPFRWHFSDPSPIGHPTLQPAAPTTIPIMHTASHHLERPPTFFCPTPNASCHPPKHIRQALALPSPPAPAV